MLFSQCRFFHCMWYAPAVPPELGDTTQIWGHAKKISGASRRSLCPQLQNCAGAYPRVRVTFINHSLNSLLHPVISALRPLVKADSLCAVIKKLLHQSWLEPPIVIVTADINFNQNAVITLLCYSSNGTKIRTEYRYNTFENLTALDAVQWRRS